MTYAVCACDVRRRLAMPDRGGWGMKCSKGKGKMKMEEEKKYRRVKGGDGIEQSDDGGAQHSGTDTWVACTRQRVCLVVRHAPQMEGGGARARWED